MSEKDAVEILKSHGMTQEEAEDFVAGIKKGMKEIGEGKVIPFYQIEHEIRRDMKGGKSNGS